MCRSNSQIKFAFSWAELSEQRRLWLLFGAIVIFGGVMYICYIDESGDAGTLQVTDKNSNPFFVVIGLIIETDCLVSLTNKFLDIKTKFFPNYFLTTQHQLDKILIEVKGNILRKNVREDNRRRRQQTIGFLDACVKLLKYNDVRILAKALIKKPGQQNRDSAFYGGSIMHIYKHFNKFLDDKHQFGFVIADSRKAQQNQNTTHTIFTQRHQYKGNKYPYILEVPTYGHSNNFAMLQLTDILCSAIIFPMLSTVFGKYLQQYQNIHIADSFEMLRCRYKHVIKNMQFMYQDENGLWCGGIIVTDQTEQNIKTSFLFK